LFNLNFNGVNIYRLGRPLPAKYVCDVSHTLNPS
jgi:hypothetical protein